MASGYWDFHTDNTYLVGRVYWSSSPIGGNQSSMSFDVRMWRTNSGYSTEGTAFLTLYVDGAGHGVSSSHCHITQNSNTQVGTASDTVTHNADGSKSVTVSVGGYFDASSNYYLHSNSGTAVLDNLMTAPAVPTIGSLAMVGDTHLDLSWTNSPADIAPYTYVYVERWDNVTNSWTQKAELSGATASYEDTSTVADREYKYRVRAWNAVGYSSYSSESSLVHTTPVAVASLTVALHSGTHTDLTWTNASTINTGVEVWHSDNGGAYTLLDTLALNALSYAHTAAYDTTHTHRYKVRNVTTGPLYSSYVESSLVYQVPAAPTGVTAVRDGSHTDVSWIDANAHAGTGFKVYASDEGGAYVHVGTTDGATTTYAHTGLDSTHHYAYQVASYMADSQQSANSTTATVEPLPVVPTNLVASRSGIQVSLVWTNNSPYESAQTLETSINAGGNWSEVTHDIAAGATTYTHTNPSLTVANLYHLRSNTSDGQYSAWAQSNSIIVQIPTDGVMFGGEF
jgi:hypothetical protein